MNDISKILYSSLHNIWGYDKLRSQQEAIINSILYKNDTVALLPTGAGKSLCYQLPAVVSEGICLVISPLLALMRDQVIQLKNIGVEAEYISSELDEAEEENIYENCKNGINKLLYISPERLKNKNFLKNIEEIEISFIAVDEAHCLSEWGQDFRPSYQNIKNFRNEFCRKVPILALTATATPKVLEDVINKLQLSKPKIFKQSFKRENLFIIHNEISDKYQAIFNYLKEQNSSGIIYVRTRKECEELSHFLKSKALQNIDYYHAGLSFSDKKFRQSQWIKSDNSILIATNAFGMGIDKDNVRFVIHYSVPSSIENYYQEIGRAGRDEQKSICILLWNEQELQNFDSILLSQIPKKNEFYKIISYLYSINQIADLDEADEVFDLDISRIQKFTKYSMGSIKNVLNFLHNQEVVFYNNLKSLSSIKLKIKPEELELLPKKDIYFVELLMRNLDGIHLSNVYFSEKKLSEKLNTNEVSLKEKLKECKEKGFIDYRDGNAHSIKFLKPRNDRAINGEYWKLFTSIQKNKIQKWEEIKFFIRNKNICKTKLILSYFGEKNIKNCGYCSYCIQQNEKVFGNNIKNDILNILQQKPSTIDEINSKLIEYSKEKILEELIYLLDSETIKMLDFRTYTISSQI